jgi:uroporphyrinogen-III decarboxylase
MTQRERLLKAIRLQKTDRVPVCTYELVGYNSHAFENREPSYKRLMDVIRKKTDCVAMWNPHSNQVTAESSYPAEITRQTKRGINYTDTHDTLQTPKGALTSSYRVYDHVHTSWGFERWCKSIEDVDMLMSIPYEPVTYTDEDYARIKKEVGDNGIIMASVGDAANSCVFLMEFGEAMVWAMTETEHFAKTMDEMHRRNMINLENMLKVNVVDLYRICGPEVITPPYLPPSFFNRFVTPYLKDMTRLIHRYGGLVRIHSHGRIGRVLDDILSVGADATDPCEAPPDGDITLRELKRRIGGQMCLFGNLQLKLLEKADTDEVREAVKICMDSAKEGGGYVIMPTAAPINVPLSPKTEENYLAFIETALELGRY